jgi:protein-ribulosamine 3-kinase
VFDVCSFYGHNEYDVGNWRAPRHQLSDKTYIQEYKSRLPASPPEDDWDARNILYSLTFNIGNALYIPGSTQRQVVYDDMTTLCQIFCPDDLKRGLNNVGSMDSRNESIMAVEDPGWEDRSNEVKEEEVEKL